MKGMNRTCECSILTSNSSLLTPCSSAAVQPVEVERESGRDLDRARAGRGHKSARRSPSSNTSRRAATGAPSSRGIGAAANRAGWTNRRCSGRASRRNRDRHSRYRSPSSPGHTVLGTDKLGCRTTGVLPRVVVVPRVVKVVTVRVVRQDSSVPANRMTRPLRSVMSGTKGSGGWAEAVAPATTIQNPRAPIPTKVRTRRPGL